MPIPRELYIKYALLVKVGALHWGVCNVEHTKRQPGSQFRQRRFQHLHFKQRYRGFFSPFM